MNAKIGNDEDRCEADRPLAESAWVKADRSFNRTDVVQSPFNMSLTRLSLLCGHDRLGMFFPPRVAELPPILAGIAGQRARQVLWDFDSSLVLVKLKSDLQRLASLQRRRLPMTLAKGNANPIAAIVLR